MLWLFCGYTIIIISGIIDTGLNGIDSLSSLYMQAVNVFNDLKTETTLDAKTSSIVSPYFSKLQLTLA